MTLIFTFEGFGDVVRRSRFAGRRHRGLEFTDWRRCVLGRGRVW